MSGSEGSSIKQLCTCAAGRSDVGLQVTFLLFMKHFKITDKNKKKIGILIFALIMLFMAAVCIFLGPPLVKFASQPEKFRQWVDTLGIWGYLAYIGMVAFQVVFAFIPGEPFELLAGYAFGAAEGTVLCCLGIALGSLIIFALTKKFGIKFVELFFPREKIDSLKILHNKRKMYTLTFIVFFIPGTPKDLLSYVAGLTPINLWAWMIISNVARLPSVITSTVSGNAFGTKKYTFAIIVFVITGILSAIGLIIYNKICSRKEN